MPPTDPGPAPDEPGSTQTDTHADATAPAARDPGRRPSRPRSAPARRVARRRLRHRHHHEDDRRGRPRLPAEPAQRRARLAAGAARPARAVRAVHRARHRRNVPEPAEPGQPAPAGRRPDRHRDGPGVRAAHRRDRPRRRHRVRARRRGTGAAPGEQRQPARRDGHTVFVAFVVDHGPGGRTRGVAADLGRCGLRRPGAGADTRGLPAERLVRDPARRLRGRGDRRADRLPGREVRHAVVRGDPRTVHLLAGRDPAAHRRRRDAGPA